MDPHNQAQAPPVYMVVHPYPQQQQQPQQPFQLVPVSMQPTVQYLPPNMFPATYYMHQDPPPVPINTPQDQFVIAQPLPYATDVQLMQPLPQAAQTQPVEAEAVEEEEREHRPLILRKRGRIVGAALEEEEEDGDQGGGKKKARVIEVSDDEEEEEEGAPGVRRRPGRSKGRRPPIEPVMELRRPAPKFTMHLRSNHDPEPAPPKPKPKPAARGRERRGGRRKARSETEEEEEDVVVEEPPKGMLTRLRDRRRGRKQGTGLVELDFDRHRREEEESESEEEEEEEVHVEEEEEEEDLRPLKARLRAHDHDPRPQAIPPSKIVHPPAPTPTHTNNENFLPQVDETECSICMDELGTNGGGAVTVCGHCFCKTCLEQAWNNVNKNCPVCRTKINIRTDVFWSGTSGVPPADFWTAAMLQAQDLRRNRGGAGAGPSSHHAPSVHHPQPQPHAAGGAGAGAGAGAGPQRPEPPRVDHLFSLRETPEHPHAVDLPAYGHVYVNMFDDDCVQFVTRQMQFTAQGGVGRVVDHDYEEKLREYKAHQEHLAARPRADNDPCPHGVLPICPKHRQTVRELTVRKMNANHGRKFFNCARKDKACLEFRWRDDWEAEGRPHVCRYVPAPWEGGIGGMYNPADSCHYCGQRGHYAAACPMRMLMALHGIALEDDYYGWLPF